MVYSFNAITGNLTRRKDFLNNRDERFGYDHLHRLDSLRLNSGTINRMTYAANGNIQTKFDVGTYQYANSNHAVSGIADPATTYSPPALDIANTSFNRTDSITLQGTLVKKLKFQYNTDNQRNKSSYYENNVLKKTMHYVGNYEKEVIVGGSTKEYDYIYTPEGLSAIAIKSGGTRSFYYVHTDHLGCVKVVTTSAKAIQTRYYYDAWGKQTVAAGTSITNRGYLAQEHLNEFGLINLNARLYDPVLGRFLGMDPFVQAAGFTQSFNRYAYGWNNPLRYADANGEWIEWVVAGIILYLYAAYSNAPDTRDADGRLVKNYDLSTWSWNPLKWVGDGIEINFGWGSGGSKSVRISVGNPNMPMPSIGYNNQQGFGMGYSYNGQSQMYHPAYNYDAAAEGAARTYKNAQTIYGGSLSEISITAPYSSNKFFGMPMKHAPIDGYHFSAFGSIYTHDWVIQEYKQKGLNSQAGQLLMHEYGHYLQLQNENLAWYYLGVAPISMYNVVNMSDKQYDHSWTEMQANTLAYYYFGRPSFWDFTRYPIYDRWGKDKYINRY
ncbi:hypothetical protein FACS1894176_06010 [Bacteroidia bacterium]|nr:hypothetical protein FACS1894176_06010 [Bacteroidia bacterium]